MSKQKPACDRHDLILPANYDKELCELDSTVHQRVACW